LDEHDELHVARVRRVNLPDRQCEAVVVVNVVQRGRCRNLDDYIMRFQSKEGESESSEEKKKRQT
jgi:hypothetical protein